MASGAHLAPVRKAHADIDVASRRARVLNVMSGALKIEAFRSGEAFLAPVVVFAYARADHLQRTVESLLLNAEAPLTDIVFYCDAAKKPLHQPQVDQVRAFVDTVTGFRSVTRVFREKNMGLARSVIDGVTQTLASHDRAIVLEDDLVLSRHFLRYMNDGLERYHSDRRVASIHGYIYPIDTALPQTFFLRGADCWGWATWSRAWAEFEPDGSRLLAQLRERKLNRDFDLDWQYPYTSMLADQVAGRNSSWAIRWHAACYLKGLLTLYPGKSLVENIGNDSSGTHCPVTGEFSRAPTRSPVIVDNVPVEPSAQGRAAVVEFFRRRLSRQMRLRGWANRALRGLA